jgi:hypothetical protein
MWKAAAVPTTKRVTVSAPTIEAAAAHSLALVSCAHCAAGAITRSTCCGFDGCAAGQICSPYDEGTARVSAVLQETEDEDAAGRVLPAVQVAQVPEQADEVRPAWSPKVPAGHNEQTAAPANE